MLLGESHQKRLPARLSESAHLWGFNVLQQRSNYRAGARPGLRRSRSILGQKMSLWALLGAGDVRMEVHRDLSAFVPGSGKGPL